MGADQSIQQNTRPFYPTPVYLAKFIQLIGITSLLVVIHHTFRVMVAWTTVFRGGVPSIGVFSLLPQGAGLWLYLVSPVILVLMALWVVLYPESQFEYEPTPKRFLDMGMTLLYVCASMIVLFIFDFFTQNTFVTNVLFYGGLALLFFTMKEMVLILSAAES